MGLCVVAAGCSHPEPTPSDRAQAQQQQLEDAQARRRSYDEARMKASLGTGAAQPSMEEIKQSLLDQYGMDLTPFQRTALLTARISSREEGEKMCQRWVAENRRFGAGATEGGN
jgi:hypothetical protein